MRLASVKSLLALIAVVSAGILQASVAGAVPALDECCGGCVSETDADVAAVVEHRVVADENAIADACCDGVELIAADEASDRDGGDSVHAAGCRFSTASAAEEPEQTSDCACVSKRCCGKKMASPSSAVPAALLPVARGSWDDRGRSALPIGRELTRAERSIAPLPRPPSSVSSL